MIVQATVTRLTTDDGFVTFEPHVFLGKTYLVDLDTIRRGQTMIHILPDGSSVPHTKDIIFVAGEPGWLPLDLIELTV